MWLTSRWRKLKLVRPVLVTSSISAAASFLCPFWTASCIKLKHWFFACTSKHWTKWIWFSQISENFLLCMHILCMCLCMLAGMYTCVRKYICGQTGRRNYRKLWVIPMTSGDIHAWQYFFPTWYIDSNSVASSCLRYNSWFQGWHWYLMLPALNNPVIFMWGNFNLLASLYLKMSPMLLSIHLF